MKTQNRDHCNIFVLNESAPPPRSKVVFKISLSLLLMCDKEVIEV